MTDTLRLAGRALLEVATLVGTSPSSDSLVARQALPENQRRLIGAPIDVATHCEVVVVELLFTMAQALEDGFLTSVSVSGRSVLEYSAAAHHLLGSEEDEAQWPARLINFRLYGHWELAQLSASVGQGADEIRAASATLLALATDLGLPTNDTWAGPLRKGTSLPREAPWCGDDRWPSIGARLRALDPAIDHGSLLPAFKDMSSAVHVAPHHLTALTVHSPEKTDWVMRQRVRACLFAAVMLSGSRAEACGRAGQEVRREIDGVLALLQPLTANRT